MFAFYSTVFVLLPWLATDASAALKPLLIFQLYGALWCGWAAMTTRFTSAAVSDTLNCRVIDRLSERGATWVHAQLASPRFARRRILTSAWAIGIFGSATATTLLSLDVADLPVGALLWWALGWALLYATAAKVVLVARFYPLFAEAIAREPEMLFPLHPARSPLVASIALVGKRMLLFWFGIAASTAAVIPFALIAPDPTNPTTIGALTATRFVVAHLAITSIFSIGVGSYMFLRSEAALRRGTRAAADVQLFRIEQEAKALLAGDIGPEQPKRLMELNALHAEIANGGAYRALTVGALSLVVPFVPLIALVLKMMIGAQP
jgi:hypothetical protein